MSNSKMKALYIVVNSGFAEQVVDFIRTKGSTGATIINTRGISMMQKEIMGISIDTDKEMVLTIVDNETADKIVEAIKQNTRFKSIAHGICFTMPVEKVVGLSQNPDEAQEEKK